MLRVFTVVYQFFVMRNPSIVHRLQLYIIFSAKIPPFCFFLQLSIIFLLKNRPSLSFFYRCSSIFSGNNRPIMRLVTGGSHFASKNAFFQRVFKVVYQFFSEKSFHSSSYYRCLLKFSLKSRSTLPLFTANLNFFRKKSLNSPVFYRCLSDFV